MPLEEKITAKVVVWDRLTQESGAAGITAYEHAELNTCELPEGSHLSAKDSVEFTRCLAPLLQALMSSAAPNS